MNSRKWGQGVGPARAKPSQEASANSAVGQPSLAGGCLGARYHVNMLTLMTTTAPCPWRGHTDSDDFLKKIKAQLEREVLKIPWGLH